MLFAGLGSVRIVKNCRLGLENAALGTRGLEQHFQQDLGHSFSLYGPPSRQITYIYYNAR